MARHCSLCTYYIHQRITDAWLHIMVMKSKFLETCHTSYRSQQLDNIITKKRFVLWQHCTTEKYGTASVAYKFYNIALRMCSLTLYHDLNIGEGRKQSFSFVTNPLYFRLLHTQQSWLSCGCAAAQLAHVFAYWSFFPSAPSRVFPVTFLASTWLSWCDRAHVSKYWLTALSYLIIRTFIRA